MASFGRTPSLGKSGPKRAGIHLAHCWLSGAGHGERKLPMMTPGLTATRRALRYWRVPPWPIPEPTTRRRPGLSSLKLSRLAADNPCSRRMRFTSARSNNWSRSFLVSSTVSNRPPPPWRYRRRSRPTARRQRRLGTRRKRNGDCHHHPST